MDRLEQIKRAHQSARPTSDNPAWQNCHSDCAFLLKEIERLSALACERVPEIANTVPLVLYFGNRQDADEFVELVREAKPGLISRQF